MPWFGIICWDCRDIHICILLRPSTFTVAVSECQTSIWNQSTSWGTGCPRPGRGTMSGVTWCCALSVALGCGSAEKASTWWRLTARSMRESSKSATAWTLRHSMRKSDHPSYNMSSICVLNLWICVLNLWICVLNLLYIFECPFF